MGDTEFQAACGRFSKGGSAVSEAERLVARMTMAEKLQCLDGDTPAWPGLMSLMNGAYHHRTWPAARVKRLGIPGLQFSDGPRGAVVGANTVFPVSMARGASFDPELEHRIGRAIGAELRAQGATYTGAVCMNLLRHPAWGRAQETYGEDPYHLGEMARSFMLGLQHHVMACMKHFALNSKENARFLVDVRVDDRVLHEVYLPHFRKVAEAGVASVMSAYNQVNGEYCGENRTLLIEILREEWGWQGFVTSDFILGLRDAAKSVQAGLNIEMPFRQQRAMALETALAEGDLDVSDVDARVTETLATFLRFADVFDRQPVPSVIACPEHRALAREAAVAGMVLLRNHEGLLPLQAESLNRVAVLGRLARVSNTGDAGSSHVGLQTDIVTPLEGIRSALPGVEIITSDGDVDLAEDADLIVLVVGYTRYDEGEYIGGGMGDSMQHLLPPADHPQLGLEAPDSNVLDSSPAVAQPQASPEITVAPLSDAQGGDRQSIRLSDADEALIHQAASTGIPLVVAIMGGSAVVMPWLEEVQAALMIWYPGMEGGHALADVLFGISEPGGRLPFAIPGDAADLVHFDRDEVVDRYGLLHGQWYLDSNETPPHLPFGFGLGYSSWQLSGGTCSDTEALIRVTNNGKRKGSNLVMVFGSVPDSDYERAPRKLLGFRKVHMDAGCTGQVKVSIDMSVLDVRKDGHWLREAKPVQLSAGFNAAADALVLLQ